MKPAEPAAALPGGKHPGRPRPYGSGSSQNRRHERDEAEMTTTDRLLAARRKPA